MHSYVFVYFENGQFNIDFICDLALKRPCDVIDRTESKPEYAIGVFLTSHHLHQAVKFLSLTYIGKIDIIYHFC